MNCEKDTIWIPDASDREMMQLMLMLGKTYNEYYFFNYGKDLGNLFEWLSLAITRMDHHHELFDKDKRNYKILKDKIKHKIENVTNPRFKPGNLAKINGVVCTVISYPRVDEIRQQIVADVLVFDAVLPVNKIGRAHV